MQLINGANVLEITVKMSVCLLVLIVENGKLSKEELEDIIKMINEKVRSVEDGSK